MELVPQHVAIIMDGNRRWAKAHGLTTGEGHSKGVDALEKILKQANILGIKFLTVYALSTENLKKRDKTELSELFSILSKGFTQKLPFLQKEEVRVQFLGEKEGLPAVVRKIMEQTEKALEKNTGPQLNIALNYGSRAEIVRAAKNLKDFNEETFSQNLFTRNIPDPDLIIRTGGEKRLSNFLLWQAAYSELYFTDILWPDFGENEFTQAIEEFKNRKRNFGV